MKSRCYANEGGGTICKMSFPARKWFCASLTFAVVAAALHAQDIFDVQSLTQLDFSHDPCRDPMTETAFWLVIGGRVSNIIDGRTILLVLSDSNRPLRVHLAGITVDIRKQYSKKAKALLTRTLLNKQVEILVDFSKSWRVGDKRPAEVTAVVHLKEGEPIDAASLLLAKGLVRFEVPPQDTVSIHSICEYRQVEAAAHSKKIGLWQ